jgi:hypothetical protein
MSEKNRKQNGNQSQRPTNQQTDSGNGSKPPPKTAAPKPEPSYGIIDEGSFWSPLKRSERVMNS